MRLKGITLYGFNKCSICFCENNDKVRPNGLCHKHFANVLKIWRFKIPKQIMTMGEYEGKTATSEETVGDACISMTGSQYASETGILNN